MTTKELVFDAKQIQELLRTSTLSVDEDAAPYDLTKAEDCLRYAAYLEAEAFPGREPCERIARLDAWYVGRFSGPLEVLVVWKGRRVLVPGELARAWRAGADRVGGKRVWPLCGYVP